MGTTGIKERQLYHELDNKIETAGTNITVDDLSEDFKLPLNKLDQMPSASDVGARPDTWLPTPADIGAAPSSHNHNASNINAGTLSSDRLPTVPVSKGGTGATTFTSGAALIGAGTGAVTTRAITNNTSATAAITGSTNLVTMNTLKNAMNRATAPTAADTNYGTAMVRAIKASTTDLTAGTSDLTNGMIYVVYE